MKLIRLLKPKTENIYVSDVQLEVSVASYNTPTMKIEVVQEVNSADLYNQPFSSENEALNAALNSLNIDPEGIKWFQKGVSNVFIARLLTDENGCIATDLLISQWKNGTKQLYLTDVYITLERR